MAQKELPEIKVILLGEPAVGKTSIIKRFHEDSFDEYEVSSITMSYVDKTIEIDNKKYKLIIWDTIGQEKYRSISKLFLNEAKIVILVYSIEMKNSFTNLDFWYNLCHEELGDDPVLGIAGNKSDLYQIQTVSEKEGKEYAESKGAIFSEISAKDNKESLNSFITSLVEAYLKKNKQEIKEIKDKIKLDKKNEKPSKKGCCGKDN